MKYSDTILRHFEHPARVGEPARWNAHGEATNPVCMDRMRLYLLVAAGRVTDAGFRAEGCVPTLAAGSWLADWVVGRTTVELAALTVEAIEEALGGLPATKRHAAHLAAETVAAALADPGRDG